MDFADLIEGVSYRVGDPTNKRHTLALVKQSINEAYEIVCENTHCYERSLTVNLTTNRYYDIGALGDILKLRHVFNTQTGFWMVPTSIGELDNGYWRWRANSGTPERFWVQGLHKLGLYPKSDVASGTVVAYGSSHAAALSADDDEPCFPEEFHDVLELYATYDRLVDDREIQKGIRIYREYEAREAALKQYVADRARANRIMAVGDEGSLM